MDGVVKFERRSEIKEDGLMREREREREERKKLLRERSNIFCFSFSYIFSFFLSFFLHFFFINRFSYISRAVSSKFKLI